MPRVPSRTQVLPCRSGSSGSALLVGELPQAQGRGWFWSASSCSAPLFPGRQLGPRERPPPLTGPCAAWGTGPGAPHLVLLEVGLQGDGGLGLRLQDSQDPQQDQPHPQRVQSGHCPGAECVTRAGMPAVQAEGGRPAGGVEATRETPIYGPGLASTQGPRTAHWRLVMLGEDRVEEPSCSLAPHRAAYVRGSDWVPGPCHLRLSEGGGRAEAPARLVPSPVPGAAQQPGWGQGACALPGTPGHFLSGAGTPHTSPTLILSPSPVTLGGDLHCASLVLKGPAGWMVTADLGQITKVTGSAPEVGPEGQACWAHLPHPASCWDSGWWPPGYPSQPGAPLASGTGPPFVCGCSYTGPAQQSGPGAPCGLRLSPGIDTETGTAPSPSVSLPAQDSGIPPPSEASLGGRAVSEVLGPVQISRVSPVPLLQPEAIPGRRGPSSGLSGVHSSDHCERERCAILWEARSLGGKMKQGRAPMWGADSGALAVVSGGAGAARLRTQA